MRKLCIFALSFSAVTALCVWMQLGKGVLLAGAVFAAVSIGAFFLRGDLMRRAAICALGLAVGLGWYGVYGTLLLKPAVQADGKTLPVSAMATGYARPTRYGSSVEAEIRLDGRRYDAVIYLKESETDVKPGDSLALLAEICLANGDRSQDSVYLRARGTELIAKARSEADVTVCAAPPARVLPAMASFAVQEKIDAIFPADAAGFVKALLTGEREDISYEDATALSVAGIYHIVAVSGMHVTLLLGMIVLLCRGNQRMAAGLGLPVVLFFVLMTGARPSAVRAGCMQALLLLAPLSKRENDFPTSLSAVLMVLLASNPWAVLDVGLQLSFASVTGIALFSDKTYRYFSKTRLLGKLLEKKHPLRWLTQAMLTAFASSLGASAVSLPLGACYFGMISLIAPIANALCLWVVSALFAAGLAVVLLAFVAQPLTMGLAWLLSWAARYILGVSSLVSNIPCAAIYLQNSYMWALGAMCYVALLLFLLWPHLVRGKIAAGSFAVCFTAILTLSYLDFHLPGFTFTALDVGQGQCLIYQCGTETCMIDCGGVEDESGELAARFLQSCGEYHVEALVLTHFDADHVNGTRQLLRRMRVDRLYLPDTGSVSASREAIEQAAREAGSELIYVREDMEIGLGEAQVQIFAPVSDDSSNDCGLSVLASRAEYDILVTGDMTQNAEWRLLSAHTLPDIELLVAGHHGAKTSTSRTLLALAQPETVIISVGEDNAFGHPSGEALERIARSGAAVYRTDENGTISIRG